MTGSAPAVGEVVGIALGPMIVVAVHEGEQHRTTVVERVSRYGVSGGPDGSLDVSVRVDDRDDGDTVAVAALLAALLDAEPVVVAEQPRPASDVLAAVLRSLLEEIEFDPARRPARVVLACPGRWPPHVLAIVGAAASGAGVVDAVVATRPVAAGRAARAECATAFVVIDLLDTVEEVTTVVTCDGEPHGLDTAVVAHHADDGEVPDGPRLLVAVRRALGAADGGGGAAPLIVLLGGSTRRAAVRQLLESALPGLQLLLDLPDDAVAIGAAGGDHGAATASPPVVVVEEPAPTARLPEAAAEGSNAEVPNGEVLDEDVQFTVYRPTRVRPERWYPLLVFAHRTDPVDDPYTGERLDPAEAVREQAARLLPDDDATYGPVTTDSSGGLTRGTDLVLQPWLEQGSINPSSATVRWEEAVHRVEFRIRVPASVDGRRVRGGVRVFLGLLLIGEVTFAVRVESGAGSPEPAPVAVRRYRSIFASYSHLDTSVVRAVVDFVGLTGDRYLIDADTLRSGERWEARLGELIRQSDVFQLFWSTNAMRSEQVRREWEFALALRREGFVRPLYWEDPRPADPALRLPPDELGSLHWARLPRARAAQPPPDLLSVGSASTAPTRSAGKTPTGSAGVAPTGSAGMRPTGPAARSRPAPHPAPGQAVPPKASAPSDRADDRPPGRRTRRKGALVGGVAACLVLAAAGLGVGLATDPPSTVASSPPASVSAVVPPGDAAAAGGPGGAGPLTGGAEPGGIAAGPDSGSAPAAGAGPGSGPAAGAGPGSTPAAGDLADVFPDIRDRPASCTPADRLPPGTPTGARPAMIVRCRYDDVVLGAAVWYLGWKTGGDARTWQARGADQTRSASSSRTWSADGEVQGPFGARRTATGVMAFGVYEDEPYGFLLEAPTVGDVERLLDTMVLLPGP